MEQIFRWILWEANRAGALTPGAVFIDGTHIKASANVNKKIKREVPAAAARYREELVAEINADREAHGKKPFAKRKETIERVFADAKEKHGMRYTPYRGLTQVSKWVRLNFVAMNLKKLARWKAKRQARFFSIQYFARIYLFMLCGLSGSLPDRPLFDRLSAPA